MPPVPSARPGGPYLGGEEDAGLRISEYIVIAHFDPANMLVSVTAADFRGRDAWYYPDSDQFTAEVSPCDGN
ncbi:MAG: hypothetical protein IPJ19_11010 [Planctomycetes bacterium]|nr:hypothetical protein [Planctomycetota bacterium]